MRNPSPKTLMAASILLVANVCAMLSSPNQRSARHARTPLEQSLFSRSARTRAQAQQAFISLAIDPFTQGFLLENRNFSAVYDAIINRLTPPHKACVLDHVAQLCTNFSSTLMQNAHRKNYRLGAAGLTIATAILKTLPPYENACALQAKNLAHLSAKVLYHYASQKMVDAESVCLKHSEGQHIGISTFWKLTTENKRLKNLSLTTPSFAEQLDALRRDLLLACDLLHEALLRHRP